MEECTRRTILGIGAAVVGTLILPEIAHAGITGEKEYGYPTPRTRNDLYHIPELGLHARQIFGEARSCPSEIEKIMIGQTALNRSVDGKRFNGEGSLRNVLLKKRVVKGITRHQYDCFADTNKRLLINFLTTLDPLRYDEKSWRESLKLASNLSEFEEYNQGQVGYVAKPTIERWRRTKKTPKWFQRTIKMPDNKDFKHIFFKEP